MGIPYINLTDDEIFPVVNAVLPAWLLLVFLPRWRFTKLIITGTAILFSMLYIALILDTMLFKAIEVKFEDLNKLEGLVIMFSNKPVMFAGWVHYVVFDLWTGLWIVEDSAARRMPHLLVAPILVFVMMLGPSGFFLYFVLRILFPAGQKEKAK